MATGLRSDYVANDSSRVSGDSKMDCVESAEPTKKKMKLIEDDATKSCKHYVKRKKRYCKMTVATGKEYCGEHLSEAAQDPNSTGESTDRIPCPLDQKHTVYSRNLRKHLKICNARPKELPDYIITGINNGPPVPSDPSDAMKLSEFSSEHISELLVRVEKVYKEDVEGKITEFYKSHEILSEELSKETYGHETRKHLLQTSSILGCLQDLEQLRPRTSFIDFGSGKGQLSYWLARTVENLEGAKVVLVDRASHRHKKDNKIEDKSFIHRIRADIADLDIRRLEILSDNDLVIVSKHLCGAATDLTLRCIINGLTACDEHKSAKVKGFLIALCCHHRCEWQSYVGKEELMKRGFQRRDFNLLTKLVSWAVCGSGVSRERRSLEENGTKDASKEVSEGSVHNGAKLSVEKRAEIGKMCKRILDYCRLQFLLSNNIQSSLRYYVKDDVTLENVCLIGLCPTVEQ